MTESPHISTYIAMSYFIGMQYTLRREFIKGKRETKQTKGLIEGRKGTGPTCA